MNKELRIEAQHGQHSVHQRLSRSSADFFTPLYGS